MLKTLLKRSTHAVPIRPQKQTVNPAVPNSDTLVDASVSVYAIHTDQGSSIFLGEDHISYCTIVRGPDILCNVIFSGCVTFYHINTFFANILFFHYWQNVFCIRVKWLRRSDLSRGTYFGESRYRLALDYEEEWLQHTPLPQSNTSAERL